MTKLLLIATIGKICVSHYPDFNSIGAKFSGAAAETMYRFVKVHGHKDVPQNVAMNDNIVCWYTLGGYNCSFLVGKDKKLYPITIDQMECEE